MCTLAETYGRPEQLIKFQFQNIRVLSFVNENYFDGLLTCIINVTNISTFVESVRGEYHLANPLLNMERMPAISNSRNGCMA